MFVARNVNDDQCREMDGYVGSRAVHWVPIPMPMPTHAHGFWVGMGAILLVILLIMLQFLNTWAQFE